MNSGVVEWLSHRRWYRGKLLSHLSHLSVHPHLVGWIHPCRWWRRWDTVCLDTMQVASVLSRNEVVLETLGYVGVLHDGDDEECASDQAVRVECSACPD